MTLSSDKPEINFDQFTALDLRVAKVLEASEHPDADKLLVLKVDVGPLGTRQIIAGIKNFYQPEELIGKLIVIVANLAPRKMRGLESQGMLLAASQGEGPDDVVTLTLDRDVSPGSTVS